MIRSLRRRFICSAMAAFGILVLILLVGVTAVSYLQLENRTDAFMQFVLDEQQNRTGHVSRQQNPVRHMRPMDNPIAYYDLQIDASGEISDVREKGIWEPDTDAAKAVAAQILASGKMEGRMSGYKFRLQKNESDMRLILMDNSPQIHMLGNVLRTTLALSLACLVLLFLILLPISKRVVHSYALHIEKQKQFITNAGHEIKTPVAIILSNVDAMELIQGENKWSRNIRSQTDRLSLLLQRLLFMSHIDEKSMVLPMQRIDLTSTVKAELETYAPILAERSLRLRCDLCKEAYLKGNREYLQQMIHMLLDNAVQYTNEGGEIGISMEQKRRRIRLMFENTVESLPDCPPESLFDRFYRGDSAHTQSSGGCGIGLSAARAIAEMHRGSISAGYFGNNSIRFEVELAI